MNGDLVVLPRRQLVSARDYIVRSGLTDAEVAGQLNARLVAPVIGAELVRLWREQEVVDPPASMMALLARLTRPARPALARVS